MKSLEAIMCDVKMGLAVPELNQLKLCSSCSDRLRKNVVQRAQELLAMGIPHTLYLEDFLHGLNTNQWIFDNKEYPLWLSQTDMEWLIWQHEWRTKRGFNLVFRARSLYGDSQIVLPLNPTLHTVNHYSDKTIIFEYSYTFDYSYNVLERLINSQAEQIGFVIEPQPRASKGEIMWYTRILEQAPERVGLTVTMEQYRGQYIPILNVKKDSALFCEKASQTYASHELFVIGNRAELYEVADIVLPILYRVFGGEHYLAYNDFMLKETIIVNFYLKMRRLIDKKSKVKYKSI